MKKKIFAFLLVFCMFFLAACDISRNKKEYVLDPLNETGISTWSGIPLINEDAKKLGYKGSAACQHLDSITRGTKNKNLMFVGTDAGGMFKSTDAGKTWKPCNVGLFNSGVCRIEIDPCNDNHVVIVNVSGGESSSAYTALYYSFDCGATWTRSAGTRGIGFACHQYYYDTLEFDAASYDANLGYCTDVYFSSPCERDGYPSKIKNDETYFEKRGIYRSTDGGQSFEKIAGSTEIIDGIISVEGDRFAVANMNGIYTKDANDNFQKVSDLPVHSLQYVNGKYYILSTGDFIEDNVVEVRESDGIYTSVDLNTFTKITNDSFPNRIPRNLMVSEKNPNYMLMFARKQKTNRYSQRPYYSHDGGLTWTLSEPQKNEELFYYYTFSNGTYSYDPDDENSVVGIMGGSVIRSSDGGVNFTYSGSGISNLSVGGLFNFNIYDENLLYVGGYDFGGAFTADGGKTWKNISLSKDGDGKDIMAGYAADKNTLFGVYVERWNDGVYFANRRYVCFSHDAGKTVNIEESVIKSYPTNRPDPKDDPYAELNVDHTIGTSFESSYQSPNKRKILFCANFRSTDNGYTWQNMLDATKGEKCLQVYTHYGKTLYGCSKQSAFVLKSDDDGKTWSKVNTTELTKYKNSTPSHITDIAVDGKNGYIYAAYSDKLWRMDMDGENLVDLTKNMSKNNFGTYRIRSVDIDKNCPEVVYCCGSGDFYMDCDSVRRSCDSGNSWQTVTPSGSASCIVKDGSSYGFEGRCVRVRKNGEVWLSTLCQGICKLTPPYAMD